MRPAGIIPEGEKGILAWFARNHVAANLLMITIVVTGILVARNIRQEVYPVYELNTVEIDMDYRGASPEEVERSIIVPIESELRGMELVRRIVSISREGSGYVEIEVMPNFDRNRALQEVTAAVQQISLFPDDAEPPEVSLGAGRRREVIRLAVYGDLDQQSLVRFARQLEDGLLAEPGIALVELRGAQRPEILVEVPQDRLRALNLTLGEIARAIDAAALDVPAGTLRTPGGDILLRTTERRESGSGFADLPILSTSEGARVKLSDIATIIDGFEEQERENYFNGRRAVSLEVYSSETQPPLEVARTVRKFVEKLEPTLPPSVQISLSRDRSVDYAERVNLLIQNGATGLILVLIALGFFLELRVAFWTAIGIPVSILGSLVLMPLMDASINMISLFGFIITLGIVVDDAVVVGEDIFHKISKGMSRGDAAVAGAKQMLVPVVFAVSTNIIAFLPLLFVPGEIGQFFKILPAVVIAVFVVSLVECLFILPSHLAFSRAKEDSQTWFARFERRQTRFRERLDDAMERAYRPLLDLAIRFRYFTLAAFSAALLIMGAWILSGRIDFIFRPAIETDFVQAEIELPSGTPVDRTREVVFAIEAAAKRAVEKTGEKDILVGYQMEVADGSSNEGEVSVMLVPQSQREITGSGFVELWRDEIGDIPDLESLFFDWLIGPGGEAEIDVQLAHPDIATLRHAADEVAEAIARYPGVEDIRKSFGREMPQLSFEIKPEGRSLGITARDLGSQIRDAFFGAEALRQPRDRQELRVMVRLPESDRRSMSGLEDLLIRTRDGGEIPIAQAATISESSAPVRIERVDGGRVVNVTANVVPTVTTGNRVLDAFSEEELVTILNRHPGLRYSFEGDQREQRDAMNRLIAGLIGALFAIFAIMAAILRSYSQAIIVLLTIPWSLSGAVLGHELLGFDLSIFSVFGMIALCGMVVNGAFVLAVTRNRYFEEGAALDTVTRTAALRRFRPILLTAITTFLGLGPMIFETSTQALFLVPMAISLGIGTLVSTVVILLLIPASFRIVEDFTRALKS
ncbi:MAG: efflux RND transporter permease subunit [Verrucomicrobiales bacterium]|nr:efflux RND transporter permease subunit [Verrucomicrobiales bacterium]